MTQAPRTVPRWMFGWTSQFTDDWGTLPAVPVLYFFMMIGALQIILSPAISSAEAIYSPYWVRIIWRVTTVAAPLLAASGWWLVAKCQGTPRLFGLWFRFAGDFSQAIGLVFFLVLRWAHTPYNDDAHVYLMHLAMGVLALVIMLVIRDLWILWRVQEIASQLDQLAKLEESGP